MLNRKKRQAVTIKFYVIFHFSDIFIMSFLSIYRWHFVQLTFTYLVTTYFQCKTVGKCLSSIVQVKLFWTKLRDGVIKYTDFLFGHNFCLNVNNLVYIIKYFYA